MNSEYDEREAERLYYLERERDDDEDRTKSEDQAQSLACLLVYEKATTRDLKHEVWTWRIGFVALVIVRGIVYLHLGY